MPSRGSWTRLGAVALAAAIVAAACTKSSPAPTDPQDPGPVSTNTIFITRSGVSPKNITIAVGSRVLFVNNDTRSHNMLSDPHPEHTDCPEFGQVGLLMPGQQRETGNLVTVRTCGFHDHDDFETVALRGSVVIK